MERRLTCDYVVFDLEANADRSDPPAHEIIEIGAVAMVGAEESGRFQTLVRPSRPLRKETRKLTGLSDADLAGAPPPAEALRRFYDFVGDRPLIAHNGFGYDFRLLDAAEEATGVRPPIVPRLDSLELAHLVLPRARRGATANIDATHPPQSRKLDALASHFFGVEPRSPHRALDDARLLSRVLLELLAELAADAPGRRLQRWVLQATGHPWADFVGHEHERVPLEEVVPPPPERRPLAPTGHFDPSAVGAMFDDGGALMAQNRRPRPQQVEMATHIAESLQLGGRRLIEAPTGTGKTLAYLVPAIAYARATGNTVVVAPHSKVLQDQIMTTLEELQAELDPFTAVLLKGANNYISLEALAGELDALTAELGETGDPARDDPAGLVLAIVCGWVAVTPTGDWDDLRTGAIESFGPSSRPPQPATAAAPAGPATKPNAGSSERASNLEAAPQRAATTPFVANRTARRALRLRLSSEGTPGAARGPLEERDFLRRARDGLRGAHVAVLNHALIVSWDGWLDSAKRLVLDEAHNLTDAATDALTEEAGHADIETLMRSLWDRGGGRSTIRRLAGAARWRLRDEPLAALQDAVADALAAADRFGEALVGYVRTRTAAGPETLYPTAYHIRPRIDTRHPDYAEARRCGTDLRNALRGVADVLNDVNLPAELATPYRRHRLEDEIARLGRQARDLATTVDRTIWAEDSEHAAGEEERWVSIAEIEHRGDRWDWNLRRVPVSVTARLAEIWKCLDSAALTSATLRVDGNFEHIIDTLGLGSVKDPVALDTPFARLGENHLLLLTDYLPAPRAHLIEEFRTSAAREIPRLLMLTAGRGMALMTARSRMAFVRDHARPILEEHGIPLLAQGDDTAPALVERMRDENATSLLALRSFWEGVDIPGEALSLLIIEKIPFDSPADPITAARMRSMELRGKDPFAAYLVPRAALRLAQGVGRLIRTEEDRGVTAVLDNRLCRPNQYRDLILTMLAGPPKRVQARQPEAAYTSIAEHLPGVTYDEVMGQRLEAVASPDPWSDLIQRGLSASEAADDAVLDGRLEDVRRGFGFESWRPGQLETMRSFIRGDDTLAVLPTGSGKSITFQIPALLSPGVTLVISPLTALMNDQVNNLRARGVAQVAAIHGGIPQGTWRDILRGAERGDYKLLYVSPERLWSQEFVRTLSRIGVARVAVDEAHCISQWGHSFRPEYAAIPTALRRLGAQRPPVLAVTATATLKVREEIYQLLELGSSGKDPITLSPDRPEIRYYVERCENRNDRDLRVVQIVEAFRRQATIVYVPARLDTTRLAGLLSAAGHAAQPYHGRMDQNARRHIEDAFRHGEVDVVVATKAFGMGIDKPDIALVVHLEMPLTIEEYVQETGRAARGAIEGTAILLRTPRDCSIHDHMIRSAAPNPSTVRDVWDQLRAGSHAYDPEQLINARDDNSDGERIDAALAVHYLCEAGGVERGLDTPWRGRLTVVAESLTKIDDLAATEPELAARAREILEHARASDSDEYRAEVYSERLGRPSEEIAADLLELNRRDILGFAAWRHAWTLERNAGHEPDWDAIEKSAERRQEAVTRKSLQAKRFAALPPLRSGAEPAGSARRATRTNSTPRCRRRAMLEYLGSHDYPNGDDPESCGNCDGCTLLERPWAASTLDRASLLAELPQRTIALRLVSDTSRRRRPYSRTRIVRTLCGVNSGQYALQEELAAHPTFGRLAILDKQGVEALIDQLIEEHLITCNEAEYRSGTIYKHLEITETGRSFLGGL